MMWSKCRATFAQAVLMAAILGVSAIAEAKSFPVTIEGMKFSPSKLEIAPGDTVVWTNRDLVPHTATSKSKEFDSGVIDSTAGKNTWNHVFKKKGSYAYSCTFHPTMTAEVVVK